VDEGSRDAVTRATLSGIGLGVISRDDGTLQVTLEGKPVYRSSLDGEPGDTLGNSRDEFGGTWTVVPII